MSVLYTHSTSCGLCLLQGLAIFALALAVNPALGQSLPANPIMFCTQVPNPYGFGTSMETFGNHQANIYAAPRGGDLYIRYPNGTLKNLTALAGYGTTGQQGSNAIAVRDPHVHWDGQKALFSMAIGAPTQQWQVTSHRWQIYEITGLGENDTPVINHISQQPAEYNNIQPIYGTDDRIIFCSDRPRGLAIQAHLYPQHDEYESAPVVTGLWRINPNACPNDPSNLEMLTHSPSGDFTPFIDSYGRIIFTRWDHLKRDQQADADIVSSTGYGTFNYANESAGAAMSSILPDIEVFPEPRASRTDLLSLPQWANTNPQDFNIFNAWMINENGHELETINHIGRHELGGNYFIHNFTNDPNLVEYNSSMAYTPNTVRATHHMQESPTTPGLYYATECGEFGSHASGMIYSMLMPLGTSPEDATFTYITHPDTRSPDDAPSANHSGLYRNPVQLSNGSILAVHTAETREDSNEGTTAQPISRYQFRIKLLVPSGGGYFTAGAPITGAGISKTVTYWTPDVAASYSGVLWETYPVEVRVRPRPATPTLNTPTLNAADQALFATAGVPVADVQRFLRRNNLAITAVRDVTSRDDKDRQQPFNLKIWGSTHQTTNPAYPSNIYEVKYLQYLQGDQLRGIGDMSSPSAGRRVLARWLHDDIATRYNPPSTGAQGSQNLAIDGSVAAVVPANRAMTWQLTDENNKGIVRERVWLSFVPGEIRICSSCHGESELNQAGLPSPTNAPTALTNLLNYLKTIDTDSDGTTDLYDAYPDDNAQHIAHTLSESFQSGIAAWINQNGGNDAVQWQAQSGDPCGGGVAVANNYQNNLSTIDALSRTVDLSNMAVANLHFDVAYSRYSEVLSDGLRVRAITCDGVSQIVYIKIGSDLATVADQTTPFSPTNCSQWRTECIDLTPFAGQVIQLVFENINGGGNRIYLDNIDIWETPNSAPTPTISGDDNICNGEVQTYTITSTIPPNATFSWAATGGIILSGQGTASVQVLWQTDGNGSLTVTQSP
ncbi:MAG: hypothetical protein IT273_00850 [Chitinophagales bacterium]|nr:hypothetical protein [Chitinophagales bacterium]